MRVMNDMASNPTDLAPPAYNPNDKKKGADKTARIPIKIVPAERLPKPDWIRVKAASPSTSYYEIKDILRADEPENLAKTIAALKLNYVVITSVDRDDLRDGGAAHFAACIRRVRELSPHTRIEILTPDFRGRMDRALEILKAAPPDVMNHNLETVPRLYKEARPGSDYQYSLNMLKRFKQLHPDTPTKSGIMVGLGETDDEILQVMRDLRAHDVDMLTICQYLMPSGDHLPVRRYVHPDTFKRFEQAAYEMGFVHAAVGAMVRSSYHADQQAHGAGVV